MRRNDDYSLSAINLLEEKYGEFNHKVFTISDFRALGKHDNASISATAPKTKEIAIDAMFGTNYIGMDLFAALAELDRSGIPLAYLLVERAGSDEPTASGSLT